MSDPTSIRQEPSEIPAVSGGDPTSALLHIDYVEAGIDGLPKSHATAALRYWIGETQFLRAEVDRLTTPRPLTTPLGRTLFMQRYNTCSDGYDPRGITPDDSGEWVRYADAQAEIDRLRVALAEAATIIRAAKRQWAPHTDNSYADMWLRRFDTPTKPIEWGGSGILDCPQIT